MAGYRPKKLDELNSMFDKTLAAEKAIKRGTTLVEKTSESAVLSDVAEDIDRIADEIRRSMGLSDNIDNFIEDLPEAEAAEDFSEEEAAEEEPQLTAPEAEEEKNEKPSFELFENITEEESTPAVHENVKPDRSGLMDEYMRIMNDEEDDDVPYKKLSRKEKKKLRMMEKRGTEQQENEEESETFTEPVAEFDNELSAPEAQKSFYDISAEATDEKTDYRQKYNSDEADADEFSIPEYVSHNADGNKNISSEASENDFLFPENYTPGWIKEDEEKEKTAAKPPKVKKVKESKKNSDNTLLKSFLCLVLALLVFIGSTATVFKTLIPVNTGKATNDTFYFFTADKDYTDLGISKGDLIITEKKDTQDGDVFAYIDYNNRTFEFGKRSDSITNDDGVVLLVTENEGSRTLVSRDDCKGVIYSIYPSVGTFAAILSDNFIIIIAAVAVSALIIILVLALALKNQNKPQPKKVKAKAKVKATDYAELEEIEEVEEIDLFTTI